MPVHDWSRVVPAFSTTSIVPGSSRSGTCSTTACCRRTTTRWPNRCLATGPGRVDLAVRRSPAGSCGGRWTGATAVALAPPRVRFTATATMDEYARKQRTLVIRHSSDDRIVALLEILSSGNKSSRHALRTFVGKAAADPGGGYHLLLIDVHPPGPRIPRGFTASSGKRSAMASLRRPRTSHSTLAAVFGGTGSRPPTSNRSRLGTCCRTCPCSRSRVVRGPYRWKRLTRPPGGVSALCWCGAWRRRPRDRHDGDVANCAGPPARSRRATRSTRRDAGQSAMSCPRLGVRSRTRDGPHRLSPPMISPPALVARDHQVV